MSNIKIQSFDGSSYSQLLPQNSASLTTYSNTQTGISATNVQDAIDSCFTSVSNGKSLIASAITDMGVSTGQNDSFQTMSNNIRKISQNLGQYVAVRRDFSFYDSSTSKSYNYESRDNTDTLEYSDSFKLISNDSGSLYYSMVNQRSISYSNLRDDISPIIGKYVYTVDVIGVPYAYANNDMGETQTTAFKVISASYSYTGRYFRINVTRYPVIYNQSKTWEVFKDKPPFYSTSNWVGEILTDSSGIIRIFSPNYW